MAQIRLIAGLGNPGREYEQTRHNAGFMIAERVLTKLGGRDFSNERKFEGLVAKAGEFLILKPQTFMNLSGRSIGALARFHRIKPEEILVLVDDVALPEGKMRLKPEGSAGGQNGLKSIIEHLGTDKFPRLRFGIGGADKSSLSGHVLGRFDPDPAAREALDKSLEKAAEAAIFAALNGVEAAMNRYNTGDPKPPRPKPAPRRPAADGPAPPASAANDQSTHPTNPDSQR